MNKFINPLKTLILITWLKFTGQLNQPNDIGKISVNAKNKKKILMIFPENKKNSRIAGHFLKSFDKNSEFKVKELLQIPQGVFMLA